eukprot:TRINITY_DN20033_c0_g1_i1.p1 TRINITY_DN20033_c0_g1~~TRINITY_DN20033_c0_g1_i1.p1  ORF type:complete len:351 (-),score=49.81 TRINITY_DN20033_c0_g1_i1:270-1322(-)
MDKKGTTEANSSKAVAKKMTPLLSLGSGTLDEIFSVKFSPETHYLVAGCSDGTVKVFNTVTGKLLAVMYVNTQSGILPVPCLKFRPNGNTERTNNVVVAGYAEGCLRYWHITTAKCLDTVKEEGNQIFCLDYRVDGEKFATAGKDGIIRIYDETRKTVELTMSGGITDDISGHSNRVFTLKYHPMDYNVILTGGWDNTIQCWDVRAKHSIKSIYGPHICGDSLDIHANEILVGSWRPNHSLEVYDFKSGRLITDYSWAQQGCVSTSHIYTSLYSPGMAEFIAAGGSNANEAKIFDRRTGVVLGQTQQYRSGVYCSDFDKDGTQLAIAGAFGSIDMFEIQKGEATKDHTKH